MQIATIEQACQLLGVGLPDHSEARADGARFVGEGWFELRNDDGALKELGVFTNLITNIGDDWYMERAAQILGSTTNIVSSTNASPIVVTANSHGLGTGDQVIVAGHATNTAAVGTWNISASTTNTITLRGTTGNGVGGATGTVQGVTLPPVTGMKLGTGSTAVAKSGAGAAIVTYVTSLTASKVIDTSFPTSTRAVPGCQIQWKTTWAAGEATSGSNWAEVVVSIESPLADDAGTAGNTIARALLSPTVAKGASDTLAVTWNHIGLGA